MLDQLSWVNPPSPLSAAASAATGGQHWILWAIYTAVIITLVLIMVMFFIYFERRLLARMQARLGPNRTGPLGLLQPVADAVKVLLKEDIIPDKADKVVWWMAPIVALFPVMLVFAIIPYGQGLVLADINIGILYILAVTCVPSVGVFMAGWGSNNKYSVLGAMRNIASVVSYEIPLVLSTVGIILISGSLSLSDIVAAQHIPFILLQPLGFLIFFVAGSAEINRTPFDLFEADSELVAGHHTEYSGMKFAIFYLVEYAEALALSAIITTLFLGGWKGPLLPAWLWFIGKTIAVFGLMIWVRATFPRVRIDQLMTLAWKFLFPLSLINILLTGVEVLLWTTLSWPVVLINLVVMLVLVFLWSKLFKFGKGKIDVGEIRQRTIQGHARDREARLAASGYHPVSGTETGPREAPSGH
jgi:NADH-quinone oxidoreductase subunit H